MPSTKGTDATNFSDSIIDIINLFNLEKKVVCFTCDCGANLKKCSHIICSELDRIAVFTPNKPIFQMEHLEYVIAWSCKAGVVDVKSEDGSLDTSITRANFNKSIIWTKK